MATNYEFLVSGRIDLARVEQQLEQMRQRYNTLDITVNLTNMDGIEHRFNELTNTLRNNLRSVTGQFNTTLNNDFNSINSMRFGLADMNFSGGQIGAITRNLEEMDLAISRIRTNINDDGGVTLNIRGLQDLNTVVNLTRTYNANGQLISETNRQIVQSFDDGSRAARDFNTTLNQARSALSNNDMSAAISGVFKQLQELGTTGHSEINTVNRDLYEMRTIFRNMSDANVTDDELVEGYRRFEEVLQRVKNTLSIIKNETGETRREQKQFNSDLEKAQTAITSGKMSASISGVTSQYKQLISTGNDGLPQLAQNLQRLEAIRNEMSLGNISDERMVELYREYNRLLIQTQNALKSVANAEKDVARENQTISRSNTLYSEMEGWLKKNVKAARVYGNEVRQLMSTLQNNKDPEALKRAALRFEEIDAAADSAGLKTATFFQRVKNIASMATGLWSTYQIIMKCVTYTKKMIQETIALDSAMGQLQIVTKATNAEMQMFYKNLSGTAKEIGASMTDLTDSATTFARLGYSMSESSTLAKYTSMLKNVGDIDVGDAQNAMTALIKAYDLDVKDIETVMDKMVEVGEEYCPAT